jgi:hypothetical protein
MHMTSDLVECYVACLLLCSGRWEMQKAKDGHYFIDRDGVLFRYVCALCQPSILIHGTTSHVHVMSVSPCVRTCKSAHTAPCVRWW